MSTKKVSNDNSNPTEENAPVETTTTETTATDETTWTDPKDYGPDNGGNNILAAWQGLFWLFDARAERFDVTNDGIYVIGFRVNSKYDPDTIVHDISMRNGKAVERRLDLIPLYPVVQGNDPLPFPDSGTMTQFMAQYARGSSGEGEEGSNRSPEYFKTAIADYKKAHGLYLKKGRPAKTFKVENLGSIDASVLASIDPEELRKLKATLASLGV